MPAIQSGYTEASWTILALRSTENTMGINPHRLCNGTSKRQWVWNYRDMHRLIK